MATLLLAACGGGSDPEGSAFAPGASGGGTTPPVTVTRVLLLSDVSTIASDNSLPAQLTAYVQDATNQFIADVPVVFTASSGGLQITRAVTDANGTATATLNSAGDPTIRNITVTATAAGIAATAQIGVTGTTLTLQGPAALTAGQVGTYTIALANAANAGIGNRAVTITVPAFVTSSTASVTTNSQGQGQFTVTGGSSGTGSITISALGVTTQQAISVNGNAMTFSAPAANAEVPLNTAQTITARYTQNGAAVAGVTINFATTRGTLSAASAVTNGAGDATVTVQSASAGGAVISATEPVSNSTGQRTIEFVATVPASIDAQPSLFTVAPSQVSTITALVRDAAGNLVKGRTVVFTLTDVTGGNLSVGSAVTDSQGRAQTVYTAGSVTSANNGVQIVATVQGTAITDTINLTVAGRQVFISLGTGNQITEPNTAQYKKEYVVQVTDSTGAGVPNVAVSLQILSITYYKGYRQYVSPLWNTVHTATCADEDVNRNGILDSGEDFNSSTRVEAGNIATISPSSVTTDASGFALVNVFYPQEYAYYLDVSLNALASVQGTEFTRTTLFQLPGLSTDFNSQNTAPPGPISPFGQSASCADTL